METHITMIVIQVTVIHRFKLPNHLFAIKNNKAVKNGEWRFLSYFQIKEYLANQITTVELATLKK